jgi:transglutaminase-like putative cysteine protease
VSAIDHEVVEWSRVRRAVYLLRQRLTYEYPGPIAELRQRLMLVPRDRHGGQRLLEYAIAAGCPTARRREGRDSFGNRVVWFEVPHVERRIEFSASIALERHGSTSDAVTLPVALGARYLAPTPLTEPDAALRDTARELARDGASPAEQAELINRWVSSAMRYRWGVTNVGTTAAATFALRTGVCQDYTQIMLALCRACGIPARYVSGHLLGEGGSHAWVEALLPVAGNPALLAAHAFDPTHGRRADLRYITVATGRDYADVAPASGTYRAAYPGALHCAKRATITAVEYDDAPSVHAAENAA